MIHDFWCRVDRYRLPRSTANHWQPERFPILHTKSEAPVETVAATGQSREC